jgi:S1-C subfamily serine protease
MLVDFLIGIMLAASIIRGHKIGFICQLFLAIGFATGLFIGAALQPHAMSYADTVLSRALLSLVITLGLAMVVGRIGESVGLGIKLRIQPHLTANKIDAILGSAASVITFLGVVWLLAPVVSSLPSTGVQQALRNSSVIRTLNQAVPSAPKFISSIERLINPNGFPDVFTGLDRAPLKPDAPLPSLGELQTAVEQSRASVVKLEGRGCGGIVEGSGFVAADGVVITNAHVVAGVTRPSVIDTAGQHSAQVIGFDSNLDIAVLRVDGLVGKPLPIDTKLAARETASVVLGYPGGNGFTASPSVILDQFEAEGRDIYGKGVTNRSIYELKADIIPGNSGGPLLNRNGEVIGVIFAESTAYEDIGYALTTDAVAKTLQQALQQNQSVGTGTCASE